MTRRPTRKVISDVDASDLQNALDLRHSRLTPVTSHPHSLALLTACPPHAVPWAFAAAETAVQQGRPAGEVLDNLRDYLDDHDMPTNEVQWAILAAQL